MSDTAPLVDMSAEPMTVTIEGKVYALPPPSMGDIAKTERWIISQQLDLVIEQTRMPPLPDEVRALAIANVVGGAVLLTQILVSYAGRLRLLYESMHRADKAVTWAYVTNEMPAIPAAILTQLMYKLAGLDVKADDEADPTTITPEPGPDSKTGEPK